MDLRHPGRVSLAAAAVSVAAVCLMTMSNVSAAITRDDDPVVVTGGTVSTLLGRSTGEIGVFRWNATASRFDPIPFQIDERVDHVFDEGQLSEFEAEVYDIFGEADGVLSNDDEIVFLFGDAGPAAPAGSGWIPGADPTRYEIRIQDPRPDAPVAERYVYVFTATGLPTSTTDYINWNGAANSSVASPAWVIDFSDRWKLTGFRVQAPCGTGQDLIDRFKGRAGPNLLNESEYEWNLTSIYVGSRVGPVRAIRYVRGAASGPNTLHHDVIYTKFWQRVIELRVHAIAAVAFYIDLLPRPGTTLYTPNARAGVTVDGVPDFMNSAYVEWAVVKGQAGGYVILYDVPLSPLIGSRRFYYKDDASYNDQTIAGYDDDDNSAYGLNGVELRDLIDSNDEGIHAAYRLYPLCAGVGDATLGDDYHALETNPVVLTPTLQAIPVSPIRALHVARLNNDVVLNWETLAGVTGYRVYTSVDATLPHDQWILAGTVTASNFVDLGAAAVDGPRFYSVVGVTATGETPW